MSDIIITQVEEWLSQVDFDGNGVLSYEEFKMCFMENISGMWNKRKVQIEKNESRGLTHWSVKQ